MYSNGTATAACAQCNCHTGAFRGLQVVCGLTLTEGVAWGSRVALRGPEAGWVAGWEVVLLLARRVPMSK